MHTESDCFCFIINLLCHWDAAVLCHFNNGSRCNNRRSFINFSILCDDNNGCYRYSGGSRGLREEMLLVEAILDIARLNLTAIIDAPLDLSDALLRSLIVPEFNEDGTEFGAELDHVDSHDRQLFELRHTMKLLSKVGLELYPCLISQLKVPIPHIRDLNVAGWGERFK